MRQFLNAQVVGPIGMSEEKDSAQMEAEMARVAAGHSDGGVDVPDEIAPQMQPTPGMPPRKGEQRRKARVRQILPTLPEKAQIAIRKDLGDDPADYATTVPAAAAQQYQQVPETAPVSIQKEYAGDESPTSAYQVTQADENPTDHLPKVEDGR